MRVQNIIFLFVLKVVGTLPASELPALRTKAAEGDAQAQYELAEASFWGHGMSINHNATLKWVEKSASQGFPLAVHRLAVMKMLGQGVKPDVLAGTRLMKKALPGMRKLADAGNADAQFKLGRILQHGLGVDIDMQESVTLQAAAAAAGHPMAQYAYGTLLFRGQGIPVDRKAAREWILKASNQGMTRAQKDVAGMFFEGIGVSVDRVGAAKWMKKAAEQGYDKAQFSLAALHSEGLGVPKDAKKCVDWFHKAAVQGHRMAQTGLGKAYDKGKGVEADPQKSYYWFTLAVRQGDEYARKLRGEMIAQGKLKGSELLAARRQADKFKPNPSIVTIRSKLGITGAEETTLISLMVEGNKLNAEDGDLDSMAKLADWYFIGITLNGIKAVSRNPEKSLELSRKLVAAEHEQGYWQMGRFHVVGLSAPPKQPGGKPKVLVAKDSDKAFEWMLKAAKKGNISAQLWVGQAYENGLGAKRDFAESIKWYKEASDQGDVSAPFAISLVYRQGRGATVKKDLDKWKEWLRKSAELGYAEAQEELGRSLFMGDDIKKDLNEARFWLRRSAVQGFVRAQNGYAITLIEGHGGPKDLINGFKWVLIAARAGSREARQMLFGIEQNLTRPQKLQASKLAEAFVPRIERRMSATNKSAPKDIKALQAAANKGKPDAQFELGRLYATGIGLKVDRVQAYKWLALADQSGHVEAGKLCLEVSEKMTGTELSKGLKEVAGFKKSGN